MEKQHVQTIKILRWIARILSVIIVGFFFLMFISETVNSIHSSDIIPISGLDILKITLKGIMLAGLIAAWIWELYGSILTLLAYLALGMINPSVINPLMLLFPVNAILFIITWWLKFHHRHDEDV
jgi:hypothetical protein